MKNESLGQHYLTVVFEYKNGAEFPKELTSAFNMPGSQYRGTKITAMSLEDEITRVEQYENETGVKL